MDGKLRSEKEISTKILELERAMGFRYTQKTKELIRTKIETLEWVLRKREDV